MRTITNFIVKNRYYIYVISLIVNMPYALQGNLLNMFTVGWCAGLLFCSLINDDII